MIEELIQLARKMREADARGEKLGLSEDELAFYDALEINDSAVQVLGDETLRTIARKLARTVRSNVTIDWTLRENVRARLRALVKRIFTHVRLPAGQTKEGDADGARTGRGGVRRLGCPLKALHGLLTGVFIHGPLCDDYFFSLDFLTFYCVLFNTFST